MIVVKNEKADPYIFASPGVKKTFAAGEIAVLSEEEWNSVPFSQRGPGKLNPLWPNEASSDSSKTKLEYYQVGADYEVRYIGLAQQSDSTADEVWIIKRFSHQTLGGENLVTEIQILENVAWDDRATLPWT